MFFTWEDRKKRGKVGELTILEKPNFSFEYAWILLNDSTAQFVESHNPNVYNKEMTEEQIEEVASFVNNYVPPSPVIPEPNDDELRERKLMSLSSYFSKVSARPIIDTGYGFSVQAGYSDLLDFQVGLELGLFTIRAADNSDYTVTKEQFEDVIRQIKQNGVRLKTTKWALQDEIKNASVEELEQINFEERFYA